MMKRKLLLLLGAVLVVISLTSCYTDPFYWGGTATVSTYRPFYGYSRGYSPYYRPYRYAPRSYGYPHRHHHHHFRSPSGHHHHHHR